MSQAFSITEEIARQVREEFQSPVYVYDEKKLRASAASALAFAAPFGSRVRYAMKANSNRNILRIFNEMGLHFDASSGFEVRRAIKAGIAPERISLSTQELPESFAEKIHSGVLLNLSSLSQMVRYGTIFPKSKVGVRLNPGLGSGHNNRTNVGGPASGFGIWHEKIKDVQKIAERYELSISRIHTHIGSGSDLEVWKRSIELSVNLLHHFPNATVLNLGGGFKVGRMPDEESTDLADIAGFVSEALLAFEAKTGRKIELEIEPGNYLVAMAGYLVTSIQDMTDTGPEGYRFLKLDAGMNDILRPSLYGAQHPIEVYSVKKSQVSYPYVIIGHCCESGDILTPELADPEAISARMFPEVQIRDICVIGGAGAYCASMAAKHYNSFPELAEILLRADGSLVEIRKRQSLDQIIENEVDCI